MGIIYQQTESLALITLNMDKVNSIDPDFVDTLTQLLEKIAIDSSVRSVVLTGKGSFFSFGFNVPYLLSVGLKTFEVFIHRFTGLYRLLFTFPKPIVAAINGHAIAGGCMLAISCDFRIMITGKPKIALNEITFGAGVFAGITEILISIVGKSAARIILFTGKLFTASDALKLGLVHDIAENFEELMEKSILKAVELGKINTPAYSMIKSNFKMPVLEQIYKYETQSIKEWLDIWYSKETRENLKLIKIK